MWFGEFVLTLTKRVGDTVEALRVCFEYSEACLRLVGVWRAGFD